MDENNIEAFDQTVGEYFALLYAAFPVRIALETYPKELNNLSSGILMLPGLRFDKGNIDWDYDKIVNEISIEITVDPHLPELEKEYLNKLNELKKTIPDLIKERKEIEKLSVIRTETASWLHQAGFISVDKIKNGQWNTSIRWSSEHDTLRDERFEIYSSAAEHSVYNGARLTTKGLEVLRAVPGTVSNTDDKTSVGGHLVEQMKDGAVDVRKATISKLVGEAISFGVSFIPHT